MRRKTGQLLSIEVQILQVAAEQRRVRDGEFYGFELAKLLADHDESRALTAHGTLYKALGRLHDGGLLEARWEDAETALAEGRPRRRLYSITGRGAQALATAVADRHQEQRASRRVGLEPS
ncbi:MAG: helix-turn-helix transcriptional regulator [Acidimicrobiales bacterium]